MKISDLIKMGLRNLFRRKARTALTVIGMVIGTISIVVMCSIGIGINQVFREAVLEDGSMSLINVYQEQSWNENGVQSKTAELNDELIEKIKQIDHVKNVSAQYQTNIRMESGKYQGNLWVNVIDYATADDFGFPPYTDGTKISKEDNKRIIVSQYAMSDFYYFVGRNYKTKSIDLEKDKVKAFFSDYEVSKNKKQITIPLNDNYGYLAAEESSQYGWNCYMDVDYFKEMYTKYANTLKTEDRKKALKKLKTYDQLFVNTDNISNVTEVCKAIQDMGISCYSSMQELDSMLQTANMLKMVFLAIGAVAMLVSAINIANTMVMSIYERTKEIGVMKVLGCLIKDIKKLFLFEAGLIGLIGGLIGIGFSYVTSWAVNKYGGKLLSSIIPGSGSWYLGDTSGAQFSQIPWWLPIAAALFSILVGVIAGFLPARRATKISAIEAMKTEG